MNFKAFQRFLLNRGMVSFYTVFVAGYLLLPTASARPATWLATLRDGGPVGLAFLASILAVALHWAWGLNRQARGTNLPCANPIRNDVYRHGL
jgi:hypothetical protein